MKCPNCGATNGFNRESSWIQKIGHFVDVITGAKDEYQPEYSWDEKHSNWVEWTCDKCEEEIDDQSDLFELLELIYMGLKDGT